jgi:hypothetical protein
MKEFVRKLSDGLDEAYAIEKFRLASVASVVGSTTTCNSDGAWLRTLSVAKEDSEIVARGWVLWAWKDDRIFQVAAYGHDLVWFLNNQHLEGLRKSLCFE